MIVCPRCSKDNQDHYKFCLGCGAELPRDQAQPKSFAAPTPPAGVPTSGPSSAADAPAPANPAPEPAPAAQFGGAAAAAAPAQPAAPAPAPAPAQPAPAAAAPTQPELVKCPSCGSNVPENFKFCGSCGHDMAKAPAAAEPEPAPASAPAAGSGQAMLVLIRPDGTEGDVFPIEGTTVVGRETAGPFASDSYLSPQHAEFSFRGGTLVVRDVDSLNGIYFRIPREQPIELAPNAVFRIGQEILRYEPMPAAQEGQDGAIPMGAPDPGYVGRVRLVIGREAHGASFCIPPEGIHLGRERGDVVFPEDGYVSGLHCRVHPEGGKVWLTDVGSSNGTFFRVSGEHEVGRGELLLMGQQLFRVDY